MHFSLIYSVFMCIIPLMLQAMGPGQKLAPALPLNVPKASGNP